MNGSMRIDKAKSIRKNRRQCRGLSLFLPITVLLLVSTGCRKRSREDGSGIDLAPFREMAQKADCAGLRNRLYVIDGRLVFWDREGDCPDNAYSQTLFGKSVDEVLCEIHDSIAGPLRNCHDEDYRDIFDALIASSGEPDLGLGPDHRVASFSF